MVQYYYNKYTTAVVTTYTEPPQVLYNEFSAGVFSGAYKAAYWNSSSGTYTLGGGQWSTYDDIKTGDRAYYLDSIDLDMMEAKNSGVAYNSIDAKLYRRRLENRGTSSYEVQGTLVQSNIIAEDGTYPVNGKHSDNYWYVRGAVAGPLPKGMVINSPYSVSGNNGRKTALMSNGWIVVVAKTAGYHYFYVDKRDGLGYRQLMYTSLPGSSLDVTIVANGTTLHIISGWNQAQIRHAKVDVTTVVNTDINSLFTTIIHNNLTMTAGVTLTVDPSTGYLYAAWACRNATHPNTTNIYYAASSNGGVTWNTPTALSMDAATGNDRIDPTIVVYKGVPTVVFRAYSGGYQIYSATFKEGNWTYKVVINGGTVLQYSASAVVDQNGVIHLVWTPNANAVYYSKSTDGGLTWSIQTSISYSSSYNPNYPSITVDKNNTVFVAWQQRMNGAYLEIQVRECNNGVWSAGKTIQSTSYNLANPSTLYDPTFSVLFGKEAGSVGYPPVAYDTQTYSVNFFGDITANNNPTIALTTEDNQTLYEASVFTIKGQAFDLDNGDAVTVRYQIDNEAEVNFGLAISDGKTAINFTRSLTFTAGRLYYEGAPVTQELSKDTPHTLKVYAIDDKGGKSAVDSRTFNVVPNRNPILTVDAFETVTNLIGVDTIQVKGSVSDPDGNAVKVTFKHDSKDAVEIYNGTDGTWTHTIKVSDLALGANTLVFTATDTYNAAYAVTKTATKTAQDTPLVIADARYYVLQPAQNMLGVTAWVVHTPDATIAADIFMGAGNVDEAYVPMTNTGDVLFGTNKEAEFVYENASPQIKTTLRLTMTGTGTIKMLSGVIK